MTFQPSRRRFLQSSAAASAALGLPSLAALLPHAAHADDLKPDELRRFTPDLDATVKLIEETPREKCIPALAAQLKAGLPYRHFLSAVFLAALRKPDSHHSAYVVHAAHEISLDSRPEERLLPLFFALDHFKWQQERHPGARMPPLNGELPEAGTAMAEFHTAMEKFDVERAERAAVALVRSEGATTALAQLWPYACRDLSFIGHHAISAACCSRLLDTVGREHSELALRFVLRDLLRNSPAPSTAPDRYYAGNLARADKLMEKLPPGWAAGRADAAATLDLFALLRQGKSEAACDLAAALVAKGHGAQPVWDAVHVAAADLLMLADRKIGSRPLHSMTAANALHYGFAQSLIPRTRLIVLLQAVAWTADFTSVYLGAGRLKDSKPIELEGAKVQEGDDAAVEEIFSGLPAHTFTPGAGHNLGNRAERIDAARKIHALLRQRPAAADTFMQSARSWLCLKATLDSHDYKLPTAVFEDSLQVSPEWRPRLLASQACWLHGRQSPDSPVTVQAREELKKA